MKNFIYITIILFAFINNSSVFAQCSIVSCNSPLDISACDEFDFSIQNTSGFPYGSSASVLEFDFTSSANGTISNCSGTEVYEYIDGPIIFSIGFCPYASWTRTWNVYSGGIVTSTCLQTINLVDTSQPTINCPTPSTVEIDLTDSDLCNRFNEEIEALTGYAFSATVTELTDPNDFQINTNGAALDVPCPLFEISYIDVDDEISCGPGSNNVAFSFTRTWTNRDKCGNQSSCEQVIQLMDFEVPVLNGGTNFFLDQDPSNFMVNSSSCPVFVSWNEPVVGDFTSNCGGSVASIVGSHTPGQAFQQGTTTVCYEYADSCGNSGQTCFDININCPDCSSSDPIYSNCDDSPIFCDLGALSPSSCTPIPDGTISNLCSAGAIHNASYFTFIAGATDLEIILTPSNCEINQGLQATVTDYCDPSICYSNNFADCFTELDTIDVTGLTIGNVYNVVVDGCNADVCEFTLTFPSSEYEIPDPETPIVSSDVCNLNPTDLIFCPGQNVSFSPENIQNETILYCWSINSTDGVFATNQDDICIESDSSAVFSCDGDYSTCGPLNLNLSEPGNYQLCLEEMSNECSTWSGSFCWNFIVGNSSVVDFGTYSICESELALGWAPDFTGPNGEQWEGGVVTTEGIHEFTITDECNCTRNQMVQVDELTMGEDGQVDVNWCANDIENWEDVGLGLDWDDIQIYLDPQTNIASVINFPGGSMQTDYKGMNCDTSLVYNFMLYEINGNITQSAGAGCDVLLEFIPSDVPSFMDQNEIRYQWLDPSGISLGAESILSVNIDGTYILETSYVIPTNGQVCLEMFSVTVAIGTGVPSEPSISGPETICADNTDDIIFNVPLTADTEYNWTITNGTPATATGTEVIISVLDASMPLIISVIATSPCGVSPEANVTYTVSPEPMVTVSSNAEALQGETTILSSSITTAQEYYWTISDPMAIWDTGAAINLSNLPVTWGEIGVQNYSLQVLDVGGCLSNVFTGEITVIDSTMVGIVEDDLNFKVSIYPNPTNGKFVLDTEVDIDKVEIYSIDGFKIRTLKNLNKEMDISDLNSGVYFINISSGGDVSSYKVIKL